jgi:SAM-dependent methyltransferase
MPVELQTQTQSHYDEYPFIEGGSNRVAWWREYLREFLPDETIRGRLMIDVGSSVGEITRGLIDRGARMVCLDLSRQSLSRCREINPEADIFNGSALQLPFPDHTFDHAISIGVLHHTPDCRKGFGELARVTAPGGVVVVFLYNYWSVYNLVFQLFKPIRPLVPLDRVPLGIVRLLQPFARWHLHQTLSDEQLRRLLGDKLWTPQATFHTVAEVRRWGREEGMTLTGHRTFFLGYANVMRFVKSGEPDRAPRREVAVRCLKCGSEPMTRAKAGYLCDRCQSTYPLDNGVFLALGGP